MYIINIYNIARGHLVNIIISNSSGKPIYEQITAQIKRMILSGELEDGAALPSMRLLRGYCKRERSSADEGGYLPHRCLRYP